MKITNESPTTVRLMFRHWVITDGDIEERFGSGSGGGSDSKSKPGTPRYTQSEVHGPGVVGETPLIKPTQFYEYSSFCPLKREVGTMEGCFDMHVVLKKEGDAENSSSVSSGSGDQDTAKEGEEELGEKFSVKISKFALDKARSPKV